MRVLLVNPPPYQRVDQYDSPDFTRLGLACLASVLQRGSDAEVEIVDAKFERLDYDAISARVRAFRPDVVGLTAFTNEIRPAARVARAVKRISPSIRTVIGGVHVSALPTDTMIEFPEFDTGVVGEGETTFRELCDAWSSGRATRNIAGIVHRDDGAPTVTGERERLVELGEYPLPAWDLVPPSPRYLLMTQRGCPYRCTFCVNPNGRTVRQRPIEQVIEELRVLSARPGARELYICDEIFTVDRERTHALLDAMIAANVGRTLRWSAQTHVNTVDRDLFRKMKAAGCFICGLGIETGDPAIQRAMKKGISLGRVAEARAMARDVGLPIEGLFIIGHPNESWESANRTIEFAARLNPDRPIFGVMVPYPGTEVAELAARREGGYRLISDDWNDYNKQIGDAMEFDNLSRKQLEMLQMLAYVRVFLDNRRYADLARFLWDYRREGAAVIRKIVLGQGPPPEETDWDDSARVRAYFERVRAAQRTTAAVTKRSTALPIAV